MQFVFPSLIQAGIDAGRYEVVRNAAGTALSIARDKSTGQFVGHAVGMIGNGGLPLNPIAVPLQFLQMGQIHQGFQAVQASLGVIQTLTALTGVGVAVNVGISAVSLWQLLKLREDVKQQRLEMQQGFLDLRAVLEDQGEEICEKIEEAVHSIEFNQHRQALAQAYGRFIGASNSIQVAMSCGDLNIRNSDLAHARQTLTETLSDYRNPHLLPDTDAVTQLRRAECAWVIEQTIATTYQLQCQPEALSHSLSHLQDKIRRDVVDVVDRCDDGEELNIIFPEIKRINDQDLAILRLWQEQTDWMRSLPPDEQKLLQASQLDQTEVYSPAEEDVLAIPSEQAFYEELKPKSHFPGLCDVLRLMMQTEQREEYETYISEQAEQSDHKALTKANLQQMSDLSIANLYWYFYVRDESEQESDEQEAVLAS